MIRIFRHYVPKFLVVLGCVEALIFFASVYFGFAPPFGGASPGTAELVGDLWPKATLYTVLFVLALATVGLYRRDLVAGPTGTTLRLTVAFLGATGIAFTAVASFPTLSIGDFALARAIVISLIAVIAFRAVLYRFSEAERLKRRVLVLGAGERAAAALDAQAWDDSREVSLVGYVQVHGENAVIDREHRVYVETTLVDLCRKHLIDELVVAIDEENVELPVGEIFDCKVNGIQITDLVMFLERQAGCIQLDALRPGTIVYADGFVQAILRGYAHRAMDLVISCIGLLLASPLMAATALAIYVESGFRGPVLYRQVRIGRNGEPFEIFKFRSMRTDAELDGRARWAQANDTRITRIGGFLRKTRLDELPQLANVLLGTMSFVGPRPERPEFVESLAQEIPYYNLRHIVNPGITGWAQICYPYGASVDDAKRKLEYDLYYIKNASFFLDVTIIIQTAQVVLWGKGR